MTIYDKGASVNDQVPNLSPSYFKLFCGELAARRTWKGKPSFGREGSWGHFFVCKDTFLNTHTQPT